MSTSSPRVSIGMPVYNGENYIREAVDSILAQTYTDFELIISDNGSTDATELICRNYASVDARVRYFRNESNCGPSWNHSHVFELAKGEYFKWMCHDDVCDPLLLEKCVHALDADPSAILCCAKLTIIDENTSTSWPVKIERYLNHPRPHQRYYRVLLDSCYALEIHGLIRSKVLRNTPLIATYPSSDVALLARLALIGPFIEIPEYLSYYRIHPQHSSSRGRYGVAEWFNPGCDGRLTFPQWKLFWEFLVCIHATPLPMVERLLCYFHLLCWPAWERNWRKLGKDILVALPQVRGAVARRATSGTAWHTHRL